MLTLWFYKDRRGRARKLLTGAWRRTWVHMAIEHTIRDLWVVSEAHPSRGVWCSPRNRVVDPDARFGLPVEDAAWVGDWMVARYGQRYGFKDILHFVSPTYDPRVLEASPRCSASLIIELCREATARGNTHAVLQRLAEARSSSPDRLFALCVELGLRPVT